MWQELSRSTGIDTTTLRTGSFATSGMSAARGIAQPGVIQIPADTRAAGASDAAAPKMYPVALGWHVRWTPDGTTVALGNSPAKAQDNEESRTWAALDPKTGAFHGTLPADAKLLVPRWNNGPVLDISVPVDMQGAPPIRVKAGSRLMSIESVNGVITAHEIGTASDSTARTYTIGSGKALAATRGGRYILALSPRARPVRMRFQSSPWFMSSAGSRSGQVVLFAESLQLDKKTPILHDIYPRACKLLGSRVITDTELKPH
jgi:hypothetical protein